MNLEVAEIETFSVTCVFALNSNLSLSKPQGVKMTQPHYFIACLFFCYVFQVAVCADENGNAMNLKNIQGIYKSTQPNMVGDGFRVFNYFPNGNKFVTEVSPFILLDYNAPHYFSPSQTLRGVDTHPHRGFETVSIVYEGAIAHKDSTGASGVIRAGDVQWMTAASGILHQEFHESEFSKKGGTLHAVQLWVNLPEKYKMSSPKYQDLLNANIPTVAIDNQGSVVRLIAGEYQGIHGSASTFTPMYVYDVRLKKGAELSMAFPQAYNSMLLVTKGNLIINKTRSIVFKDFVLFGHQGEIIVLNANEDSMVLVLSGAPINEPVVQSGPFVMNTQQEIMQANKDYNSGKFGSMK